MVNLQHHNGAMAELYVASKLMENGYTILWPHGSQIRYDLAIEFAGKFERVQVKKATWSNTGWHKYLQARISSRNKESRPKYETGEFEYFAFTDMDRVWLAPFEELEGNTSVCLGSTNPNYRPTTKYEAAKWLVNH